MENFPLCFDKLPFSALKLYEGRNLFEPTSADKHRRTLEMEKCTYSTVWHIWLRKIFY